MHVNFSFVAVDQLISITGTVCALYSTALHCIARYKWVRTDNCTTLQVHCTALHCTAVTQPKLQAEVQWLGSLSFTANWGHYRPLATGEQLGKPDNSDCLGFLHGGQKSFEDYEKCLLGSNKGVGHNKVGPTTTRPARFGAQRLFSEVCGYYRAISLPQQYNQIVIKTPNTCLRTTIV